MTPLYTVSPLSPEVYFDADVYRREFADVFERHWVFAGFADQLTRPNDYIVAQIGRRSVVIQNFDGELNALHNVCSHRHATIRCDASGNGPLRCVYHGWTYGAGGVPVGVPNNREIFGFDEAEKHRWSLCQFEVDRAGPFVFVRVASGGPSLREHLGPLAEIFDALGRSFSLPFEVNAQEWRSNWKLGVENTLEPYHAGFVHPDSLAEVVELACTLRFYGRHSSIHHQLQDKSREWWSRAVQRAKLEPCPEIQEYNHYFIYPNLCIGITYGTLLSVQTFEPVTPETSRIRYRLLLPKVTGSPDSPPPFRETLAQYLTSFNEKVLEEDRDPLERCQKGCGEAMRPACHGSSESRVNAFLHAVADDLKILQGSDRNGCATPSDAL